LHNLRHQDWVRALARRLVADPSRAADVAQPQHGFEQLDEEQRAAITMAKMLGMSHAAIGAELGRTPNSVVVFLHRALAKLGVMLAEESSVNEQWPSSWAPVNGPWRARWASARLASPIPTATRADNPRADVET